MRSELFDMARRWHLYLGCWATVMVFFPNFRIEKFSPEEDIISGSRLLNCARRICFTLDEPIGEAESPYVFLEKNPDSLVFDIGDSNPNVIRESALGMKTNTSDALNKWKCIFKLLRSETSSGVFMVSRKTGQYAFYKNLRYTPSAAEASKNGVELLSLAPAVFGVVGKPEWPA